MRLSQGINHSKYNLSVFQRTKMKKIGVNALWAFRYQSEKSGSNQCRTKWDYKKKNARQTTSVTQCFPL